MQGVLCKGFHFRYDPLSTADLKDCIETVEKPREQVFLHYSGKSDLLRRPRIDDLHVPRDK